MERLLIISHTRHYLRDDEIVGWGPTVRELDYLSELFDEVVHLAPIYGGPAPDSALAYTSDRIRLRTVRPAGGETLAAKLDILRVYPDYARAMREELAQAQYVHVRCPANISLLALYLLGSMQQPLYRWVKYAGNWQPDGREPRTYGWQRRWLRENRPRAVVTVNGRWPDQPAHVYSFYNPSLTSAEVEQGRRAAAAKQIGSPVELLFVGALNDGKGVGRVLQVALELQRQGTECRLRLLGDGPDRSRYEAWVTEHGLRNVHFQGWVPREATAGYYAAAHFILLPSQSEGWPKVLSEAMAYGAVPVAASVSSIPQILAETGAGVAYAPHDIEGQVAAIERMIHEPDRWRAASQAGVAAAHLFTYRHYQQAVAQLFQTAWGVQLPVPDPPATPDRTVANVSSIGVAVVNGYTNGRGPVRPGGDRS